MAHVICKNINCKKWTTGTLIIYDSNFEKPKHVGENDLNVWKPHS